MRIPTRVCLILVAAVAVFGADNSLGGVKVTTTGENMDGTPINSSYTAKYDGKEYPVTGAPPSPSNR